MLNIDVTVLYVFVTFLVAFAILKRFLFQPLGRILEDREKDEATATRVYAESMNELSRAIDRAEQALSAGRQEALKQRETLRAEGRTQLERKLAQAQASARATLERASREIAAQAAHSAQEIPQRARSLARTLAEKILGRKLAA